MEREFASTRTPLDQMKILTQAVSVKDAEASRTGTLKFDVQQPLRKIVGGGWQQMTAPLNPRLSILAGPPVPARYTRNRADERAHGAAVRKTLRLPLALSSALWATSPPIPSHFLLSTRVPTSTCYGVNGSRRSLNPNSELGYSRSPSNNASLQEAPAAERCYKCLVSQASCAPRCSC